MTKQQDAIIPHVRLLTAEDAKSYQALRLRALQEHPEAYGSSYEDDASRSLAEVGKRLQTTVDGFTLGAWQEEKLVGVAGLHRSPRIKTRHRGGIGGMYVAPETRGQGIGGALLQHVIDRGKAMPYLEEIILAVTVGNVAARSIYLAAGFAPAYIEERYLKIDGRYYDIEWMVLRFEN